MFSRLLKIKRINPVILKECSLVLNVGYREIHTSSNIDYYVKLDGDIYSIREEDNTEYGD